MDMEKSSPANIIKDDGKIDFKALKYFLVNLLPEHSDQVLVFALRIALRVCPLIYHNQKNQEKFVIAAWRVMWIISRIRNVLISKNLIRANDFIKILKDANSSFYKVGNADNRYDVTYYASATVINILYHDELHAAENATQAAFDADIAYYHANGNKIVARECERDVHYLALGKKLDQQPLWTESVPDENQRYVKTLSTILGQWDTRAFEDYQQLVNGHWLEEEPWDKYEALWEKVSREKTSASKQFAPWDYLHADTVSNNDYLNRQPLAKALACWLNNQERQSHWTIGLFGDWGVGKSTFVNLIKNELGILDSRKLNDDAAKKQFIRNNYIAGEFNAWRYEHSDNIQAGLAQEVVVGLLQGLSFFDRWIIAFKFSLHRKRAQLYIFALSLFLSLYYASNSAAGIIPFVVVSAYFLNRLHVASIHPLVKEAKSFFKGPDFSDKIGDIPRMREQIETLVEIRSEFFPRLNPKKEKQRLLFVIDDLDRCSPETVVKTLEAVRLVMDLEQVIVIIAIDQKIALASLAKHYKELSEHHTADPKSIARDYIGKVIHVPILLEDPSQEDIKTYLDNHLWEQSSERVFSTKPNTDNNKIRSENSSEELQSEKNKETNENAELKNQNIVRNRSKKQTLEETPEQKNNKSIALQGLSDLQKEAFVQWTKCFGLANPRHIKRLNNAYTLIRHRYPDEDDNGEPFRRLTMLLWVEYINELPLTQRDEVKKRIRNKQLPIKSRLENEDREGNTDNLLHTDISKNWQLLLDYLDTEEEEQLNSLYQQVKTFSLPAVESDPSLLDDKQ